MLFNTLTSYDQPAFRRAAARSNMAYARGAGRQALLGETISESFRATVRDFGGRPALVVPHQDFRATYDELWQQVDLAARALMARGVRKGDRVGISAPSRYEWVVTQLAAARAGAVLVPIDPRCSASELVHVLNEAGVGVVVMTAEGAGALQGVRGECPALRSTVGLDVDWDAFLFEGLLVPDWEIGEREASLQFDGAICVQYTWGAPGPHAATTFSHQSLLLSAQRVAAALDSAEQDRVCVPVPLHHAFGMVAGTLGCLTRGACIVLPSEWFDAGAALTAVERERCTALLGEPSMFADELGHADLARFDLSSLDVAVLGGRSCPVELITNVREQLGVDRLAVIRGLGESRTARLARG